MLERSLNLPSGLGRLFFVLLALALSLLPTIGRAEPVAIDAVRISARELLMDYPWSGRLSAIAADPENSSNVIVAGETGGLFYSGNALSSTRRWTALSKLPSNTLNDVLIVPGGRSAPPRIWAASLETFESSPPMQLWRSDGFDGNWSRTRITGGSSADCGGASETGAFRFARGLGSEVFLASGCGVARTRDGENWEMTAPVGERESVYALAHTPDRTLVAGTRSGIWFSSDQGSSWQRAVGDVATFESPNGRFALEVVAGTNIVLAMQRRGAAGVELTASFDSGRSWQRFATTVLDSIGASGGLGSVYVDAQASRSTLFVSNTLYTYQASCAGATLSQQIRTCLENPRLTWHEVKHPHRDSRQVLIVGEGTERRVFLTSDGGLHAAAYGAVPTDPAVWTTDRPSSGLNALQIYTVIGEQRRVDGVLRREIHFGTQDNMFGYSSDPRLLRASSGLLLSPDGTYLSEGYFLNRGENARGSFAERVIAGPSLRFQGRALGAEPVSGCDGLAIAGDSRVWSSPTSGWGHPIWLGGSTYIQDSPPRGGFSLPSHWHISRDSGCSWSVLSTAEYPAREGSIARTFGWPPSQVTVGMRAPEGDVRLATLLRPLNPHGASWRYPTMIVDPADRRGSGITLERGIAVSGAIFAFNPVFDVDPQDPNHMLAVESQTGRLMVSRNGGDTWSEVRDFTERFEASGQRRLKSNLDTSAIWSISFSPWDSRIVIVGTVDDGILVSTDGGNQWRFASDADGVLSTSKLTRPTSYYWDSPSRIVVSSYGRGLWELNLAISYEAGLGVCPPDHRTSWLVWICYRHGPLRPVESITDPLGWMKRMHQAVLSEPGALRAVLLRGDQQVAVLTDGSSYQLIQRPADRLKVIYAAELDKFMADGYRTLAIDAQDLAAASGVLFAQSGPPILLDRLEAPKALSIQYPEIAYSPNALRPKATRAVSISYQGAKFHAGMPFYPPNNEVRVTYSGLPANRLFVIDGPLGTSKTRQTVSSNKGVVVVNLGRSPLQGLYEFRLRPANGFEEKPPRQAQTYVGRYMVGAGRFFRPLPNADVPRRQSVQP